MSLITWADCKNNYIILISTTTVLLLLASVTLSNSSEVESYGLGDQYNWKTLDDGYELAKEQEKPLMLIIHKSWCGACKALKPKFKESTLIHELSKQFIMVNTQDDDEPEGEIYQPDGGYIPRILFFDHDGNLLRNIVNEDGNPKYKYYYSSDEPIAKSMKNVLKLYSKVADEKENEDKSKTNKTKIEL